MNLKSVFKEIIKNKYFWPVVLVIFFGLLAGKGLIGRGYFNMHDDLQMMRQLEMEKCFKDLQIPCRWVPDMGYGFGFPLFNYYPPLPYLFGQIVRIFGFSFVNTVKIVFIFSFVASGVGMYFLANEFFQTKFKFKSIEFNVGAIIASIFYIWAPYHSVDVYVRGAMNEAWGLIWFPVLLLFAYKLIKENVNKSTKWILLLSLSWFGLLTSHNLMVLIFTPIFGLWCLFWIFRNKSWEKISKLIISGILAFGLAAFFTLPVALESKLVHTDSLVQGYYEYVAHFATLNQLLFTRFWGYGASVWLEEDKMSFQIGHIHWILSLVTLGLILYGLYKKRKASELMIVVLFFLGIGWFSAYMAHLRSTWIWLLFPPLKFVQFPWRFLTIVIFGFSFAVGSLPDILSERVNNKKNLIIGLLAIPVLLIIFNWNYFRPEYGKLGPLTDKEKFSDAAWDLQRTAGIYDYLPNAAKEAPKGPQTELAEVMSGGGIITEPEQGTNWGKFKVALNSDGVVRINIFSYPDWEITIDGEKVTSYVDKDERWGRMYIDVPKGAHEVKFRLNDTLPRRLGNYISLTTWVILLIFIFTKRKNLF